MLKIKTNDTLLTKEQFKTAVFLRDNHKCVFCSKKATTSYHIIDKNLFSDSACYLNNGVSLCEEHLKKCETTDISLEDIWNACFITNKIIPVCFDSKRSYDRYGNLILENGKRIPGANFNKKYVQDSIQTKLNLFN